jgi:hypothetical protein
MHSDLDYERLAKEIPAGVVPAYDGMRIVGGHTSWKTCDPRFR